jgi:hypothetical protein
MGIISYDDWHRTDKGGFWTTRMFWDCDCATDYIRPKTERVCPECGAVEGDGYADSRVEEVLKAGLAERPGYTLYGEDRSKPAFRNRVEITTEPLTDEAISFVITDGLGSMVTVYLFMRDDTLNLIAHRHYFDEEGNFIGTGPVVDEATLLTIEERVGVHGWEA